jgi:hypothetical protein
MRRYHSIIILLFIILICIILYYLVNNSRNESFDKTKNSILEKVTIIRTSSPPLKPDDITEEYHLWLKIEMARKTLEELILSATNTNNSPNDLQNFLFIQGFGKEGNIPSNQDKISLNNLGLPLICSKRIIFSTDSFHRLTNTESLSTPYIGSGQIDYQNQFYIKSNDINNLVTIYIHLETNIKPKQLSRVLSVTITQLNNNTTIASKTIPLFQY